MASSNKNKSFTFIDLFAGIGGTRIGFESNNGKCVYSSEWDKQCQKTYQEWFGELPAGDITKVNENDIPEHDILVAGFPCQPFSIAGVSKKISLGRKHGFDDEKQGNLFFEIARILHAKRPKVFMLENVKNLKSHDKGRTYEIIFNTLVGLGYKVYSQVHDARYYVPQHRERIIIVGFRNDLYPDIDFHFPDPPKKQPQISDILEKKVDDKYTLSDKLWNYLQNYAKKHKAAGNGFGFGLIDPEKDTTTRTLSARYYKDGSEILIKQPGKNPRRLTPRECARLMGFKDNLPIVVSDTAAYKQFGNSVCVPMITDIGKQIRNYMSLYERKHNGQNHKSETKLEHVSDPVKGYSTRIESEKISVQQRLQI